VPVAIIVGVVCENIKEIAVTLQKEWKVIVYTGTIAKATTCGREQ
jgi:hypothetical protein